MYVIIRNNYNLKTVVLQRNSIPTTYDIYTSKIWLIMLYVLLYYIIGLSKYCTLQKYVFKCLSLLVISHIRNCDFLKIGN